MGGIPTSIQTYELAQGTALFEPRYNGFVRNVRALNCSSEHMARLNVVASSSLRYVSETDACMSSPCLNHGVCSVVSHDSAAAFKCDCTYTSYEGRLCDKSNYLALYRIRGQIDVYLTHLIVAKAPKSSSELTFTGKEYFSYEMPSELTTYEEEFTVDFRTSRSTGLLAYAGK